MREDHTAQEVNLMKEHMGYSGVPNWIFMAALGDWGIDSEELLKKIKDKSPTKSN